MHCQNGYSKSASINMQNNLITTDMALGIYVRTSVILPAQYMQENIYWASLICKYNTHYNFEHVYYSCIHNQREKRKVR